jgi:DNA-directed RNA polymerase specialized sigma24 family protein
MLHFVRARRTEHVKPQGVPDRQKFLQDDAVEESIFAPRAKASLSDSAAKLDDSRALPDQLGFNTGCTAAFFTRPQKYRAVFLLREVEELSTGETAKILAVSTDAVKTRSAARPAHNAPEAGR